MGIFAIELDMGKVILLVACQKRMAIPVIFYLPMQGKKYLVLCPDLPYHFLQMEGN